MQLSAGVGSSNSRMRKKSAPYGQISPVEARMRVRSRPVPLNDPYCDPNLSLIEMIAHRSTRRT
jgi:hypothetical protein